LALRLTEERDQQRVAEGFSTALSDPQPLVRPTAASALRSAAGEIPEAGTKWHARVLIVALQDPCSVVRKNAATALGALVPRSPGSTLPTVAAEALNLRLNDDSPDVQKCAAKSLACLAPLHAGATEVANRQSPS